jgi:hypothetical protein
MGGAIWCPADQQVSRGDIAMDDVVAVQHIERAAGICAQPQCPYRIIALPTKII